jgi:hypothetical protein
MIEILKYLFSNRDCDKNIKNDDFDNNDINYNYQDN